MRVLLEYRIPLSFPDLLEDDLLGQLRGNAAQRRGIAIHADLAANLYARSQLTGLRKRNLVERVFHLLRIGNNRLIDVGGNLARFLVQLPTHVFLSLVKLARGQGNGLFDRADNDAGVDSLFCTKQFDTLVQRIRGHSACSLL